MICDACTTTCPEVFYLAPAEGQSGDLQSAIVKADAGDYFQSKWQQVHHAAEGCCVAVIKIEYVDGSRSKYGEEVPTSCCKQG